MIKNKKQNGNGVHFELVGVSEAQLQFSDDEEQKAADHRFVQPLEEVQEISHKVKRQVS